MLKEQVTFIDDKTQEFLLGNIDDTRTVTRSLNYVNDFYDMHKEEEPTEAEKDEGVLFLKARNAHWFVIEKFIESYNRDMLEKILEYRKIPKGVDMGLFKSKGNSGYEFGS